MADIPPDPDGLTPQERRLVECAAKGEWWEPERVDNKLPPMDPANSNEWDPNRIIRAEIVRCLLAAEPWHGEREPWTVSSKGLLVMLARIVGVLNLEGARIERSIWMHACAFDGQINFNDAKTKNVSLQGSYLRNGVSMSRSTIGGSLYLRDEFKSLGAVDFSHARIRGDIDCTGGTFAGEGDALAINGNSASIGGGVFLLDFFNAKGEVDFYRADVRGSFRCEAAKFLNDGGTALNLGLAKVGAVLCFMVCEFKGLVVLNQTKCGFLRDFQSAWPAPGRLIVDGFVYRRFHDCPTDWATRAAWLSLQEVDHLGNSFRPQPWIQAANVLRQMGHERDARELSVARERVRAKSDRIKRQKWNPWRRYTVGAVEEVLNSILRATIGYGYKPWRVVYWSLGLFLIGWFIFSLAANYGYMAPRQPAALSYLATHRGEPVLRRYTEYNSFVYAWDAYLPVVDFGQTDAWEPSTERDKFAAPPLPDMPGTWHAPQVWDWIFEHGVHRVVGWSEEFLGWIFVSLFVAGMSGLVKKE